MSYPTPAARRAAARAAADVARPAAAEATAPGPPPYGTPTEHAELAPPGSSDSNVSFGTKYRKHAEVEATFAAFTSMVFAILSPWLLIVLVYHAASVLACSLIVLIFFTVLGHLHHSDGNIPAAALSSGMIVSAMLGLRCYYADVLPLYRWSWGREATATMPVQPAKDVADAFSVRFTKTSTVDHTKALGVKFFESGSDTFCVAPITDAGAAGKDTGVTSFWAVGINCCGNQGDFSCDEGQSAEGGGEVLHMPRGELYKAFGKFLVPSEARADLFSQAVKAAGNEYELNVGTQPALVRLDSRSNRRLATPHIVAVIVMAVIVLALSIIIGAALTMPPVKARSLAVIAREALRGTSDFAAERHARLRLAAAARAPSQLETNILGFAVPFIVLLACILLFSYAPCWELGRVILCILVAVLLSGVSTLMMVQRNFLVGVIILLSAAVGSLVGHWTSLNYTFHYCSVDTYNDYHDVLADTSSMTIVDAGKVWFVPATYLAVDKSVGTMHMGKLYCAAPILPSSCGGAAAAAAAAASTTAAAPSGSTAAASTTAATTAAPTAAAGAFSTTVLPRAAACNVPHADFWAIGKECCSLGGGSFTCFKSNQLNGNAGLVVRNTREEDGLGLFPDEAADGFGAAVAAARTVLNLPTSDTPMMLMWGSDPKALRQEWIDGAARVIVLTTAIAFFVLALVANGGLALLSGSCTRPRLRPTQDLSPTSMGSPSSSPGAGVRPPRGGAAVALASAFGTRPGHAANAAKPPPARPVAADSAVQQSLPVLPMPHSRRRR